MRQKFSNSVAVVLFAFGLVTLLLSSSVIFGLLSVSSKDGDPVLFVVWSNFLCSILYLFASYGFMKTKKIAIHLLAISVILLTGTFIGFIIHINTGGSYESLTIFAIICRLSITLFFLILAYFSLSYFERYSAIGLLRR